MSSTIADGTYSSLSDVFANRKSDEVFEIEILTPELGPLLRDGLCFGITKVALVKAFLVARQRLTKYLVNQNQNVVHGISVLDKSDEVKNLAIATQIILLFDCEHVTACNWRKRYITSSVEDDAKQRDPRLLEDLLQREMTLMTSFQCSPLHRHTKSPTLWQHRLWIMAKLLDLKEQSVVDCETSKDSLRMLILEELDVVCKSGQLHPRNYYAFSYIRQLHALVCQYSSLEERVSPEGLLKNNSQALLTNLAIVMVEPMLKWCLSNPSDISGWMYLFYLLNFDSDTPKNRMITERILVMKKTIHFAVHIATWEGESLWTFVDLMVAKFGVDILPTIDCTTPELWNSSSASGARWKAAKLTAYRIYKGT